MKGGKGGWGRGEEGRREASAEGGPALCAVKIAEALSRAKMPGAPLRPPSTFPAPSVPPLRLYTLGHSKSHPPPDPPLLPLPPFAHLLDLIADPPCPPSPRPVHTPFAWTNARTPPQLRPGSRWEKAGRTEVGDVAEAKEVFNLYDEEGDGKIDGTQVGDVARACGLKPTNAMVNKAAGGEFSKGTLLSPSSLLLSGAKRGRAGDKRLSFEEWLPMYEQLQKEKEVGTFHDFMEGLRVFDKDETGKILGAELRHILLALGSFSLLSSPVPF